jgi:hypothetical protein
MPVRKGDDRTPTQKGHDEQLRRQHEETRQANRGRRESLDEARLAEKRIGIERAKLELEARRGELVHKDLVFAAWQMMVTNAGAKLNAIGSKLGAQLVGRTAPEIKETIDQAVTEALAELNEFDLPQEPGRGGAPARSAAAMARPAKAQRKRVGRRK